MFVNKNASSLQFDVKCSNVNSVLITVYDANQRLRNRIWDMLGVFILYRNTKLFAFFFSSLLQH